MPFMWFLDALGIAKINLRLCNYHNTWITYFRIFPLKVIRQR